MTAADPERPDIYGTTRPANVLSGYLCEKIGAGDGIRTHDPNLGKVVLYP